MASPSILRNVQILQMLENMDMAKARFTLDQQQMGLQQQRLQAELDKLLREQRIQGQLSQAATEIPQSAQYAYDQNVAGYDDLMSQWVGNPNMDLDSPITIGNETAPAGDWVNSLAPRRPTAPKTADEIAKAQLEAMLLGGNLEQANTLSGMLARGDKSNRDAVFGQQLRGLGVDMYFLSHNYGGGKIPTTAEELEVMTRAAAKDPDFKRKRTDWSNMRIANTMESKGLSAVDPTKNVVQDRFGNQFLMDSKGDTIDQRLTNPTTEETTKLHEYGNTFREIGDIREEFEADFVGLFDGNWNNVKSKFANSAAFQRFKSKSNQLRTIIYGLSGKQINQTEQEWLDTILAKIYQPDENFQANLDVLEEWVRDRHNSYLIELRNARRYTSSTPLPQTSGSGSPTVREFSAEQFDEAFRALGPEAPDADINAWLNENYGAN